jgi:tellurite resistance protein TehA-like permease
MNQLPKIPWGTVFSNFLWIVGAAIILAAMSYHDYLASQKKEKLINLLKRNSFQKPLFSGLFLVTAGIALSVHFLWLSFIMGILAIFMLVMTANALKRRNIKKHDQ